MIVRDKLQAAIKEAADNNDRKRLCTLRLIQTAIRDRDQAHCVGNGERIAENEVADLLNRMIEQRRGQIAADRAAGYAEKAAQTEREIAIIREFMPALMDESDMKEACRQVVSDIGAHGLRDVGRTITALKKRYPGRLDVGRASCVVKGMLR